MKEKSSCIGKDVLSVLGLKRWCTLGVGILSEAEGTVNERVEDAIRVISDAGSVLGHI